MHRTSGCISTAECLFKVCCYLTSASLIHHTPFLLASTCPRADAVPADGTVEVAGGNTLLKACLAHFVSTGVHNRLRDELKAHRAVDSIGKTAAMRYLTPYKLKVQLK